MYQTSSVDIPQRAVGGWGSARSTRGHENSQWDVVSMERLEEILPGTTQEVDLRQPTTQ